MFDTLAIVRSLTDAGIDRKHAASIAGTVAKAADHDHPSTKTALDAALTTRRTGISAAVVTAEVRMCRAMLVHTLAVLGGLAAILRLLC